MSALGTLATRIALYPLGLAATVVLARVLGPHDRGLYAFLVLFSGLVLPICLLGFGTGVHYQLSSCRFESRQVAVSALLMGGLLGALASLVGLGLYLLGVFGEAGAAIPPVYVGISLALLPIQGSQLVGTRILYGQSSFAHGNVIALMSAAVLPILILVMVGAAKLGLLGAIGAYAASAVIMSAVQLYFIIKSSQPILRLDRPFIRRSLTFGLKSWTGAVANRANVRLDQFLLAIYAPASELGVYAIAVRMAELLWILPDGIASPFHNRMAAMAKTHQRSALMQRMHRLTIVSMAGLATVFGVASFYALPWIFGSEYAGAQRYTAILIPGVVIMISAKITTKFFSADNRPSYTGILGIVGGIAGTVAYFILVPAMGAIGAAMGSCVAYAATSLAGLVLFRHAISGEPRPRLLLVDRDDMSWLAARARLIAGKLRGRFTQS